MTTPDTRSVLVTFRTSPTEFEMLQELAGADGLYQSDVLRLLIRREHAERFGVRGKVRTQTRKGRVS